MLETLTWLIAYQVVGEVVCRGLGWPLPGPVLGMVLLFITLCVRRTIPDTLKRHVPGLLSHMSLLFVPVGVGVMAYRDLLTGYGWQLAAIVIVATAVTLLSSALLLHFLLARRQRTHARSAA
ncbi:CidA/LrgA family protein [Paludibacterium yongneupense]|uniref:CidA/LrgA family protein n=1 Tax=Paludibacterium yongneupense TaxID=400061 RepID=UPI00040AA385|nr:CidA/LrgA family protein [Paludibacterium yongneupense]